ncbi:MAG TPA: hypothetical protein VFL70_00095 [Bacteroidia bacterium]|nr:hypothetical protein [Bacteroidia bacterium]
MSTQNLLSNEVTDEAKTEIRKHLSSIDSILPFLISLTNEERKSMLKLGDKTVAFMDKALDYAHAYPMLIPPYVSIPEVEKDYQLQKDLVDILQWINSLVQKLEDTQQEAGAEAYNSILGFYQSVKVAAEKDVPGARAIYEDLSERFPGRKKSQNPTPDPAKN